jgi:mxaC protein
MALATLIVAGAGPYDEGGVVTKVGKGAEIVIVLDRSGSMSEGLKGREQGRGDEDQGNFLSKIESARSVLLKFMQKRPADTFGVIAFNSAPISVAPLSSDRELAQAALLSAQSQSTGFTAIGRALALALDSFEGRPYTATRLILLVSDGDAIIEKEDQEVLKREFARHHTQLMWIYVRGERELSIFDTVLAGDTIIESSIESASAEAKQSEAMHQVFNKLGMPYQAFEVDSVDGLNKAIQDVSRATNKPSKYEYRLPRQDYAVYLYMIAMVLIGFIYFFRKIEIRSWN